MAPGRARGYLRNMAESTFLKECREDRDRYAGYLKDCEEGRFHIRSAGNDGVFRDETESHMEHLRRIIAELDVLIAAAVSSTSAAWPEPWA